MPEERGRALDIKMDKEVIRKLSKTKWFKSQIFYRTWKNNRGHKIRQFVLDANSYHIALALRGKKLVVFLDKNNERGDFSPYVVKNGHEWAIGVLDAVDVLHDSDAWWMGAYETEEEAVAICKEMHWTLCEKRVS